MLIEHLLDFISLTLSNISRLWLWLNEPLFNINYDNSTLIAIISNWTGQDFSLSLTPIELIGTGLLTTLTVILVLKFLGYIWGAVPVL